MEEEFDMGDPDRKKPNFIVNGFVKLVLGVIVFGIAYVLFFNFCFLGN